MAIILNLAMKLMDVDEKKRPYPIWAHLIIKKIFFLLQWDDIFNIFAC